MRKISLLFIFIAISSLLQAQRFYYIESNHITDYAIQSGLQKASQYITKSPLASDFIIKTDIGYSEISNELSMSISVQDSMTLKTIYRNTEKQQLTVLDGRSRFILGSAIRYFIDRNMSLLIDCARQTHADSRMLFLKSGKDKT